MQDRRQKKEEKKRNRSSGEEHAAVTVACVCVCVCVCVKALWMHPPGARYAAVAHGDGGGYKQVHGPVARGVDRRVPEGT